LVQRTIEFGQVKVVDDSQNLAELMVQNFELAAAGVTEPFLNDTSLLAGASGNRIEQMASKEASAQLKLPKVAEEKPAGEQKPSTVSTSSEGSAEGEQAEKEEVKKGYFSWVSELPVNKFEWQVTVPKAGEWKQTGVPPAKLDQLIAEVGENALQTKEEDVAMRKAEEGVKEATSEKRGQAELEQELGRARGRARQAVRSKFAAKEKDTQIPRALITAVETIITQTITLSVDALQSKNSEEERASALNEAVEDALRDATTKVMQAGIEKEQKPQLSKLLSKYDDAVREAVRQAMKDPSLVKAVIEGTLTATTGKLGGEKKVDQHAFKASAGTVHVVSPKGETDSLRLHSISHESQHVADHQELIKKMLGPWDEFLTLYASREKALPMDEGTAIGFLSKADDFTPGAQRIVSEIQAEMRKSGDQYHLENPKGAPPRYRVTKIDLENGTVVIEMQREPLLTSGLALPPPQYTWNGTRISG
jgi:hypothetical protein